MPPVLLQWVVLKTDWFRKVIHQPTQPHLCIRLLYWHSYSPVDRVYHNRAGNRISVSTLFTAAILPGIVVLLSIMLANIFVNRFTNFENSSEKFDMKILYPSLIQREICCRGPFLILGGIYSGVFTPTEAAGVAVVFIISIGLIQNRYHLMIFKYVAFFGESKWDYCSNNSLSLPVL